MRTPALLLIATLPLLAHEPERISIDSKVLGEKRTLLVHLPSAYASRAQLRFPVIYLTDASTRAGHTAATMQALADAGRMPESIVVGVVNTDRNRDLTPTRVESVTLEGAEQKYPTSGGAAKFITFFETELIPEIERRYRTEKYRILAGHSFGAMFTLETLFTKPRLFNAYIAISPTMWWDDQYPLRRAAQFLEANPELNATLILGIGNEQPFMLDTFNELKALFAKKSPKGFTVHSYFFEEDDHVSVPLHAYYVALRKLFLPWHFQILPADDTKTLWPRATAHAAELSKRYGFTIPVQELRANGIGRRLLDAGLLEEALEVFRANVKAFPDSEVAKKSLREAEDRIRTAQTPK
jgi:uncharacterized protein